MEAMSQDEDLVPESNNNFNSDELTTPEVVVDQLKTIAETGNVDIDWADLQRALKLRLKNVLDHYIEKNRDCKEEQYQEPNVEKFNLENSRDEILDLIDSFNDAPFTIQRICELLHSPFKYYDRVSTFLRGLEKNLRVISSNNWPKSQVDTSRGDIISVNNQPVQSQEQPSKEQQHHLNPESTQENIQPNIQVDEGNDMNEAEVASDIIKDTEQVLDVDESASNKDGGDVEQKTNNIDQVESNNNAQEEKEEEKQPQNQSVEERQEEVCVQADIH